MDYSIKAASCIKNVLEQLELVFHFDEERGVFDFGMKIDSKLKNIKMVIKVHDDRCFVYTYSPINADNDDEDVMVEMAKFLHRANRGLSFGNFEFDIDDGEIRYKILLEDSEDGVEEEKVMRAILISCKMLERYGNGMIDVMFAGENAEDAIAECEDND